MALTRENPFENPITNIFSNLKMTTASTTNMHREVHAPMGSELACKGWLQEAAYRMIQNNLDPDVAERPDELVVYGGSGKAARNWECYDAILARTAIDNQKLTRR